MAFVYWIHHKDTLKHSDITQHGYVGITSRTVAKRFRQHQNDSKKLKYPIHFAFQKYGDEMVVDTLVEGSVEYCQFIEQKLRPTRDIGYNCAIGGAATSLGAVYSQETRNKISEAAKGRVVSEEARKSMSSAQLLRAPASAETRLKLSLINKGKVLSEETREKLSIARKGKKCKPFSEEHRQKLSLAGKGRTQSEEAKEKIRVKATGRVKTQEAKDKFLLSMEWKNLWESSSARKDLWAVADDFKRLVDDHPKKSARAISVMLGYSKCNPWKLVDKIRAGWIPSEDSLYMSWLSEYNKEKECYGT